ncbi:hypothetical protein [Pseudomonas sp. MUP55]|uniref:hypothetical protein n=1 Tax=Pseudomonas sp. MUP55 TaxID=3087234 RepID=UPI002A599ECB|nr:MULTISPECIES: hypothetical protein [unclassified Pseudomonas]WPN94674.1 hypothetical protein SC319_09960 [Pseudomonas sp. MUP56]WPO00201.1 hypothetical protein SC318_09960 [Pseudomonas sp. MUP55]
MSRLERGLVGLALALGLAIAAITSGIGDDPDWLPEQAARSESRDQFKPVIAPSVSLDSLAATWKTPLFSPDRSPDHAVVQAQAASLSGLTLTGVLINGELRVALLKRSDGPPLNLHQGQSLPNGWKLDSLTATHAEFSSQGRSQRLALYAPRLPPPSTTPPIFLPHESTP